MESLRALFCRCFNYFKLKTSSRKWHLMWVKLDRFREKAVWRASAASLSGDRVQFELGGSAKGRGNGDPLLEPYKF
jgi:hypothetical protein